MTERIEGQAAADALTKEVGSWPDVNIGQHRFGGQEFLVGRRELGHIHVGGESFADLPFPRKVRDELIAAGRARVHHALPDSGWLTVPIRTDADLKNAIEIFRLNYERPFAPKSATNGSGAIKR